MVSGYHWTRYSQPQVPFQNNTPQHHYHVLEECCVCVKTVLASAQVAVRTAVTWVKERREIGPQSEFLHEPSCSVYSIRPSSSGSELTHSHWRSKIMQFHFFLNAECILHEETTRHSSETAWISEFYRLTVQCLYFNTAVKYVFFTKVDFDYYNIFLRNCKGVKQYICFLRNSTCVA